MQPKILGYKLRRKSDGLYYVKKGSFGKRGSIFTRLCDVFSSINHNYFLQTNKDMLLECEIVELVEGNSTLMAFYVDKLTEIKY